MRRWLAVFPVVAARNTSFPNPKQLYSLYRIHRPFPVTWGVSEKPVQGSCILYLIVSECRQPAHCSQRCSPTITQWFLIFLGQCWAAPGAQGLLSETFSSVTGSKQNVYHWGCGWFILEAAQSSYFLSLLFSVMYLLTIDIYQSIFLLRPTPSKSLKSLNKTNVVGRWAMSITHNPSSETWQLEGYLRLSQWVIFILV